METSVDLRKCRYLGGAGVLVYMVVANVVDKMGLLVEQVS